MKRRVVNLTEKDLPYSSAVMASGNFVWTSGHVGYDLETGEAPEDIEAQTELSLENLKRVLEAAGTSFENVVKVNVYLKHVTDAPAMNAVYRRYFPDNKPARATVGAPLLRDDLLVEIEMVALLPDGVEP